jgi:hypothetical protein
MALIMATKPLTQTIIALREQENHFPAGTAFVIEPFN